MEAQAIAARLMIELCGARVAPGTIDIGAPRPAPRTLRLRDQRVTSLLGTPVPRERSRRILEALEFATGEAEGGLDVTVPPFRRDDVTREADLIEEVARLDGLEKLPATLPSRHGASGRLTACQRLRRRSADALTAQGLHEVVGWSFASPDTVRRLRLQDQRAVTLANPMSAEQSQLRSTLLGSLLDVAQRNLARGAGGVLLFEAGAVYLPRAEGELPREPHQVGALLIGAVRPPSWRDPQPRAADFFAAKGVLQGLLDTLRVPWHVQAQPRPFLHPGRAASVHVADQPVGWVGEIHPQVAAEWDIRETVAGFELDLDAVAPHAIATSIYEDLTSYPAVREDLAVVVSDEVSAAEVVALVRRVGRPLLASVEVFDVYRDPERIGLGNVSLALRLAYRAPDRTLTDEEVAERRERIVAALADELGGRVRDS
jgi:phenylalanyl-tRNA synthetase beta chain